MENELQGNILGTGFTGNGFDIYRNPDINLDDYFVRERCDRFSMALPHYVQRSLAIKSI